MQLPTASQYKDGKQDEADVDALQDEEASQKEDILLYEAASGGETASQEEAASKGRILDIMVGPMWVQPISIYSSSRYFFQYRYIYTKTCFCCMR